MDQSARRDVTLGHGHLQRRQRQFSLQMLRHGGELLVLGNKGAWDQVRAQLNRVLRGWSAYFSYGALASAYEAVDQHVYDRTPHFLRQRHKVQGRGADQFSREYVYGKIAVRCLRRERSRSSPCALR
jgi:RNA-directed DNA polymerase